MPIKKTGKFIVDAIITSIALGLVTVISDYILRYFFNPDLKFGRNIFQELGYYSALLFCVFFGFGIFLLYILFSGIQRNYQIHLVLKMLIGMIVTLILGYISRKATLPLYNVPYKEIRHIIIFCMIGAVFPLVQHYTRKFNLFNLNQ